MGYCSGQAAADAEVARLPEGEKAAMFNQLLVPLTTAMNARTTHAAAGGVYPDCDESLSARTAQLAT